MQTEEQASRHTMMAFLVANMQLDIIEASEIVAELEEAKLIQVYENGDVAMKELEGDV
ncbi:TPA: hypothetical protein U1343_000814 [Streptococcus suis]|uniref:hypothetical protein n=1 Tax=Streptococcus TaxID=1301 RepID=UPI00143263CE|nr:hypothetical protein [Streptococcus suis]MCQ8266415.1 hypothetical protein [Streptococcus suis]NJW39129.1 hypothetical protein [Streptococcus suis]NQM48084.1 hypothetical protein [Streptococcus suis]HEM4070618.1 hypothetical protein [Streptococcus suis]